MKCYTVSKMIAVKTCSHGKGAYVVIEIKKKKRKEAESKVIETFMIPAIKNCIIRTKASSFWVKM